MYQIKVLVYYISNISNSLTNKLSKTEKTAYEKVIQIVDREKKDQTHRKIKNPSKIYKIWKHI